jgi:hypothetical protein
VNHKTPADCTAASLRSSYFPDEFFLGIRINRMKAASPYLDFNPELYLKHRFAPLAVTYVENDVQVIVSKCGFTFQAFLSAAAFHSSPIRFVDRRLQQMPIQELQKLLRSDLAEFAKCFVPETFESTRHIQPNLTPFPALMPVFLSWADIKCRPLPWYRTFVMRLLEGLEFIEFAFVDVPVFIDYVVAYDGDIQTPEAIRSQVEFPLWMREFVADILLSASSSTMV